MEDVNDYYVSFEPEKQAQHIILVFLFSSVKEKKNPNKNSKQQYVRVYCS